MIMLRTTSRHDANETTNTIPIQVEKIVGIRSQRTNEKSTKRNKSMNGTGAEISVLTKMNVT
jgi:hypothetical protein